MKFDISVLLDRSGSMQSRKDDHIGGLRSFINDNKNQGETDFTLIQFDSTNPFELVFDGVKIEDIDTDSVDLIPRGSTPLLDAVGKTVAHIEQHVKGKENEIQVVLMIITDGAENSSREWTKDKIQKAIKDKENDWKILYLGANVDAFDEAGSLGLSASVAMNYANTPSGTAGVYNVSTDKLSHMRRSYNQGLSKKQALCSADFTEEDRVTCADTTNPTVNLTKTN